MYSLYRAWLSMSQSTTSAPSSDLHSALPLNLSAPHITSASATMTGHQIANVPDVQLQVGPSLTNFSAHRNVLSAHSGFFKAALCNGSGPILVPNIQVDEFSSLLTFMYTGYLDLNLSNIYNILLATHILHMPRALEMCRSFLMQSQSQQHQQQQIGSNQLQIDNRPTSIIKPIASRKPLPPLQYEPTIHAPNQTQSEEVSGEVKSAALMFNHTESVFKKINHPKSNIGREKPEEKASTSSSGHQELIKDKKPKKSKAENESKTSKITKKRQGTVLNSVTPSSTVDERVIVDIACCDGPVRFHRVINKNYGQKIHAIDTYQQSKSNKRTEEAINKVMTENIKLADAEGANAFAGQNEENGPSDLYTCLYCNHTFKSQYCYQKHARRHLNPVDNPVKDLTPRENKREFKLLDMNVQYYPCKTCGSKFPSYYFVHKHRKLCHAEEMADGNNKNNEIVQVKPKISVLSEAENKNAQDNNILEDDKTVDIDVVMDENEENIQIVEGGLAKPEKAINEPHFDSCNNSCQSNHSDIIDVEDTN